MVGKEIGWEKVVRIRIPLLSIVTVWMGFNKYFRQLTGLDRTYSGFRYVDGNVYYKTAERLSIREKISREPHRIIPHLLETVHNQSMEFMEYAQKIGEMDFDSKSNAELAGAFKGYLDEYSKIYGLAMLPLEIDAVAENAIEKELEKRYDAVKDFRKLKGHLLALSIASRETELIKEKKELLEISIEAENDASTRKLFENDIEKIKELLPEINNNLFTKIKKHHREYAWMDFMFLEGKEVKLDDVLEQLKGTVKKNPKEKLDALVKLREDALNEFNAAINEIKPSKEFFEWIGFLREAIFLRTNRLEAINRGNYCAKPLLDEIGRRLGIRYDEVIYMFPEEVEGVLLGQGNVDKAEIKERQKAYALVFENNERKYYVGEALKGLEEEEEKEEKEELSGTVACRGTAIGIAKIVHNKSELSKVEKGDILVTEMTTPDFVVAMEKAAAIVTDIGGMTCHAAIISRELGIPCIIGTEKATKVFRDGDLLKVDAERGIVKKTGKQH